MAKSSVAPVAAFQEITTTDRLIMEPDPPIMRWSVRRTILNEAVKRFFDTAVGTLLLIFLTVPMLLIALYICLSFSGPVIYRQTRIGSGGQQFICCKFRTMITGSEELLDTYLDNHPQARSEWELRLKLERDPRVTGWGRILRTWSLDELPQLWNVIRGDMSLVGPRPLLPSEIDIYGEAYEDYCRVKPGMTGLWQVSGRNTMTFDERARLDSWYVDNWTLMLDLKLLLLTIPTVLGRKGAY